MKVFPASKFLLIVFQSFQFIFVFLFWFFFGYLKYFCKVFVKLFCWFCVQDFA